MIDFKKIIAEKIAKAAELQQEEIVSYIEVPPNQEMGDYAFPCFKLAKTLKSSTCYSRRSKRKNSFR